MPAQNEGENELAEKIAEAFIRWPLPESVCADPCATRQGPGRFGTNLLSWIEAKQMAEQVILPLLKDEKCQPTRNG